MLKISHIVLINTGRINVHRVKKIAKLIKFDTSFQTPYNEGEIYLSKFCFGPVAAGSFFVL